MGRNKQIYTSEKIGAISSLNIGNVRSNLIRKSCNSVKLLAKWII